MENNDNNSDNEQDNNQENLGVAAQKNPWNRKMIFINWFGHKWYNLIFCIVFITDYKFLRGLIVSKSYDTIFSEKNCWF